MTLHPQNEEWRRTDETQPAGHNDLLSLQEQITDWVLGRRIKALKAEALGALCAGKRLVAQRNAMLLHAVRYARSNPRADITWPLALWLSALADNERGASWVSLARLGRLFKRGNGTMTEAYQRLEQNGQFKSTQLPGKQKLIVPLVDERWVGLRPTAILDQLSPSSGVEKSGTIREYPNGGSTIREEPHGQPDTVREEPNGQGQTVREEPHGTIREEPNRSSLRDTKRSEVKSGPAEAEPSAMAAADGHGLCAKTDSGADNASFKPDLLTPAITWPQAIKDAIDRGKAPVAISTTLAAATAALRRGVKPWQIEMAARKAIGAAVKEALPREPADGALLAKAATFIERSDGERIATPMPVPMPPKKQINVPSPGRPLEDRYDIEADLRNA